MNIYQTLTGQNIWLTELRVDLCITAQRIIEENKKRDITSGKFKEWAFKFLKSNYPYIRDRRNLLSGTIGIIYRDCFYRLLQKERAGKSKEKQREFLHEICFNPARILLDRYLDGEWISDGLFSHIAGIEPHELEQLFEPFRKSRSKRENRQTDLIKGLKKYQEVCKRLFLTTQISGEPGELRKSENLHCSESTGLTTREIQLITVVATATRILCGGKHKAHDRDYADRRRLCWAFIFFYSLILYNSWESGQARSFTSSILEQIEDIPGIIALNSENLQKNLDVLVRFSLGLGKGDPIPVPFHRAHDLEEFLSAFRKIEVQEAKDDYIQELGVNYCKLVFGVWERALQNARL